MAATNVWIGTSGFQYPEWKGKFYPEDLATTKMLKFYAGEFSSTEVNYTFRSLPSEKTVKRWCDETPDDFRFSLKAPQKVTHFAKLKGEECKETIETFFEAVAGLGEKLGPVLFQLPPTFKADVGLLKEFLAGVAVPQQKSKKKLAGVPMRRLAFEFRHESWLTDEVYGVLAEKNVALCVAESEEFETPQVATADFGYLRPRREDYTPAQIKKKWAKFVSEQREVKAGGLAWGEVFVYFKHEETCAGPEFAKVLMKALAAG